VTRKTSFHWAWIILATCFLNLFINYSVRLGYGVVLPEMIKDLSLSRAAGGTIFNAFITICLAGILLYGSSWVILSVLVGTLAVFYGVIWPMYGACAGDYFPKEIMGTVIGAWTPFYGLGAILVHWVSGVLRDSTGSYDYSFAINTVMAALAVLLICTVKKNTMSTRYLGECQKG